MAGAPSWRPRFHTARDALIESLEHLVTKKRRIKQGATQGLLGPKDEWIEKGLGSTAILKARIGWQGLTIAEYLLTDNCLSPVSSSTMIGRSAICSMLTSPPGFSGP